MAEAATSAVGLRDESPSPDPEAVAPSLPEAGAPASLRLAVPLILAAGWGALLTFSVMFLMEDGRSAVAAPERLAAETDVAPGRSEPLPSAAAGPIAAVAAMPARTIRVASTLAEPPPQPATAAQANPDPWGPPGERPGGANYVGVWGPTVHACGANSRRRGYLPARITEEGAQAGRTLCRFRNGRREGPAWVMAADCSDRGRRWTSQVRLIVDGDRLTWTSAKGSSSYIRCGRRDG